MRILRTASAIALAVAVSCLGIGCAGGGPQEEGQAAASSFLDEIRAGRVEPAWRATTVEFKSLMGLGALKDYVKAHPALKGQAEFVEGRPEGANKPGLAEYTFRATAPPNPKSRVRAKPGAAIQPTPSTIRITTAREDGAMKVERLALE